MGYRHLVTYVGLTWQKKPRIVIDGESSKLEDPFVVAFKAVHPRKICLLKTVPGNKCTDRSETVPDYKRTGHKDVMMRCRERRALPVSQ